MLVVMINCLFVQLTSSINKQHFKNIFLLCFDAERRVFSLSTPKMSCQLPGQKPWVSTSHLNFTQFLTPQTAYFASLHFVLIQITPQHSTKTTGNCVYLSVFDFKEFNGPSALIFCLKLNGPSHELIHSQASNCILTLLKPIPFKGETCRHVCYFLRERKEKLGWLVWKEFKAPRWVDADLLVIAIYPTGRYNIIIKIIKIIKIIIIKWSYIVHVQLLFLGEICRCVTNWGRAAYRSPPSTLWITTSFLMLQ